VDDGPIRGSGEWREAKELMAQYDAPAYIRRARQVQDAFDSLIARCRQQREEWLAMVRLRVGMLRALAGDWHGLCRLLEEDQIAPLRTLHDSLAPELRAAPEATTSLRALRRALEELRESIERFNHRWAEYLAAVDLGEVNRLREDYNRYYLLEKECALRSAAAARHGFCRLEPLTPGELDALFPPLPIPRTRPE
jgi:hypothetical protein